LCNIDFELTTEKLGFIGALTLHVVNEYLFHWLHCRIYSVVSSNIECVVIIHVYVSTAAVLSANYVLIPGKYGLYDV